MKSPIKDNPLHNPAESLDKEIDKIINDKAIQDLVMIIMLLVLTGWEWWTWFRDVQPHPINISIVTTLLIPIFVYRIYKHHKRSLDLNLVVMEKKQLGNTWNLLEKHLQRYFMISRQKVSISTTW